MESNLLENDCTRRHIRCRWDKGFGKDFNANIPSVTNQENNNKIKFKFSLDPLPIDKRASKNYNQSLKQKNIVCRSYEEHESRQNKNDSKKDFYSNCYKKHGEMLRGSNGDFNGEAHNMRNKKTSDGSDTEKHKLVNGYKINGHYTIKHNQSFSHNEQTTTNHQDNHFNTEAPTKENYEENSPKNCARNGNDTDEIIEVDLFHDEVKVYKYEGEQDQPSSENLSEDKIVLVTDAEEDLKLADVDCNTLDKNNIDGLPEYPLSRKFSSFSYPPFINPYPGLSHGFHLYNDLFPHPPPAHMGFPSWTSTLCPSSPIYPLPPAQTPPFYPALPHPSIHSSFYPHMPPWSPSSPYALPCYPQLSKLGFSYPMLVANINRSTNLNFNITSLPSYPPSNPSNQPTTQTLSIPSITPPSNETKTTLGSSSFEDLSKTDTFLTKNNDKKLPSQQTTPNYPQAPLSNSFFPLNTSPFHSGFRQFHSPTSSPSSSLFFNSNYRSSDIKNNRSDSPLNSAQSRCQHIKKPLNAFMLFMKEMRQTVIDECTLKESAAINQILGRKWHSLERSEQTKYYEMARKEKELHKQLYPSWTARDNYAINARKRKKRDIYRDEDARRNDGSTDDGRSTVVDCMNAKKCRARYGIEQQHKWCKPCRRKKRCIRFMQDNNNSSEVYNEDEESQPTITKNYYPIHNKTSNSYSSLHDSNANSIDKLKKSNVFYERKRFVDNDSKDDCYKRRSTNNIKSINDALFQDSNHHMMLNQYVSKINEKYSSQFHNKDYNHTPIKNNEFHKSKDPSFYNDVDNNNNINNNPQKSFSKNTNNDNNNTSNNNKNNNNNDINSKRVLLADSTTEFTSPPSSSGASFEASQINTKDY